MIFTEGLSQVMPALEMGYDSLISFIPDADFVSFNGAYTKPNLEKFYEGLVTKFQNHPPMSFNHVKTNDRLLLSYFFENVHLPDGFRVSATPVVFRGKKVRSLQYYHQYASDTGEVYFYKNDLKHEYALKVKINGGKEELVMYNCPDCKTWIRAEVRADSLIRQRKARYYVSNKESVLVPELDFVIAKDLDKSNTDATLINSYKLAEERIKFKISAPKEGGPLETNTSYNTPVNFIMNGNVLVYLKETGKKTPYCIIYIKHPEILKRAK